MSEITKTYPSDDLRDDQISRYARHLVLPEIDMAGQAKLLAARVLVIGAGGLGCSLLSYLAAAGVGQITIADFDRVSRDNLTRQTLYRERDTGDNKAQSAARFLMDLNPDVQMEASPHKVEDLLQKPDFLADFDIVADASDNPATRVLLSDACYRAKKPLVFASAIRFTGQLSTFKPYLGHGRSGADNPCYRCVFGDSVADDPQFSCADVGIFGPVTGIIGSWQAMEVIREVLGFGESLAGHLLLFNFLDNSTSRIRIPADASCSVCAKG